MFDVLRTLLCNRAPEFFGENESNYHVLVDSLKDVRITAWEIFSIPLLIDTWLSISQEEPLDDCKRWEGNQCDQIAGLFFNIWPFTSMRNLPKVYKIWQSRVKILPNRKWTLEKLPKSLKILPKWRNLPNLITLEGMQCDIKVGPWQFFKRLFW